MMGYKTLSQDFIDFFCIGRPSPCIRVVLPGEALHVNLTVLLLLLFDTLSVRNGAIAARLLQLPALWHLGFQ